MTSIALVADPAPDPVDDLVQAFIFSGLLSYRMLDNWTRSGYLHATDQGGTGYPRRWHRDEVGIAAAMVRLGACGIPPATAVRLARSGPGTTSLCEGLTVTATADLWATPDLPASPEDAKRARVLRELAGLK